MRIAARAQKFIRQPLILSGIMLSILLFSSLPVLANTGAGTLDNTDSTASGNVWEACAFTVDKTGTYSIPTVTSSTGAYVFVRVNVGPNLSDKFTGVYGNTVGNTITGTLIANTTYYAIAATPPGAVPLDYNFVLSGAGNAVLSCPPGRLAADTPPDKRINWHFGDLSTVIYEQGDGVVVYCYNNGSWLAKLITQELVDSLDRPAKQDIPLFEYNENACHFAFYILDTGEYQINIWNPDGKLSEVIANNLNFRDAKLRHAD
jgi:hypothetical protein